MAAATSKNLTGWRTGPMWAASDSSKNQLMKIAVMAIQAGDGRRRAAAESVSNNVGFDEAVGFCISFPFPPHRRGAVFRPQFYRATLSLNSANRKFAQQDGYEMRRAFLICSAFAMCLQFVGCATLDEKLGDKEWYQKTRSASAKAMDVSTSVSSKTYKRMQDYLAKKDLLATFQDAGEHGEEAVLGVLQKAGMTRSRSAAAKPPPATSAKPSTQKPSTAKPSQGNTGTPATPSTVPEKYAGTLVWPVDAGIFSSEFGKRKGKPHKGIDIAADVGEPVHAIADGEVIYAGEGLRGYGKVVILRHDSKMSSLYAHNSELKVKQGDHVIRGELVSLLGNTGRSTGPHVHFEIREGEVAVNPRTLLPKPEFGKVASNNADAHPPDEMRRLLARTSHAER